MEIERKFLMDSFPEGSALEERRVEQYYICTDPYVRIRSSVIGDKISYKLTFKGEGTLSRTETEIDLRAEQFEELKLLCKGRPLKKHTKVYPLEEGLLLEVSAVNEGEEGGFFYAEVEFPTEEAAKVFIPLPCLGKEITYDPEYKMNNVYLRFNGK